MGGVCTKRQGSHGESLGAESAETLLSRMAEPVVVAPSGKHTATIIFLHGLGDTGMGWAGALNTIRPDYLKVILYCSDAVRTTLQC